MDTWSNSDKKQDMYVKYFGPKFADTCTLPTIQRLVRPKGDRGLSLPDHNELCRVLCENASRTSLRNLHVCTSPVGYFFWRWVTLACM